MHQHRGLGGLPGRGEDVVEQGEPARDDLRCGLEIAEDELVALLGDLRRGRNVDHERNAFLLGDLRDGGGGAGIEWPAEHVATVCDQPFGARARGIDIGFEIDDDNLDRLGIADLLEQRRGDIGAALAGLADTGLHPRQRQDHADFQRPALRTPDVERCGAGEQTGGACTGGEAAAGNARASGIRR